LLQSALSSNQAFSARKGKMIKSVTDEKPLRLAAAALALVAVGLVSCARDYVTGRPSFTVVNEATELRIGAEEDQAVVAMFGVYDDEKLAAFVDGLGQDIVEVSHRPNLSYTFRVLDSPVLNAFALPGGYVYVTRGLMAYVDSTDELVGVLAHEVGHVAGRHSAEQISRQIVASGFGLLNAVSRVAPRLGGLLFAPSKLLLLSHSRRQEKESDKLGVEYATRLGYDARELARFLNLLHDVSDKDGRRMPTFFSTHPDSGDRAGKVMKLSKKWREELSWEAKPVDRASYLALIDGIVFGENPRQGYTENGYFYHPDLGFQFPYRESWTLMNSPAVVVIISPEEDALIQLTAEEASSPKELALQLMDGSGLKIRDSRETQVFGLNAYVVESETPPGDLRILSYFIQSEGTVYTFHAVTIAKLYDRYEPDFKHTLGGFQRTVDPAVLQIKPDRVRIKTADKETTLRAFLESSDVSSEHYEAIEQLSGKSLDDTIDSGETIKVVVK
jgi:predicted Zn-dependent protease